ncbi:unnamed protein product [Amoebophrya sp. A25]|nr:unnamed protein product [Amoebophrya sp. A25]|eukprot:GSA25T00020114001.1
MYPKIEEHLSQLLRVAVAVRIYEAKVRCPRDEVASSMRSFLTNWRSCCKSQPHKADSE